MVAVGTVEELRTRDGAGRDRGVVLDVDGPPAGWADGVPDVEVVSVDGARTRLRLTDGVDDQYVLRAAVAAGPVHGFRRFRPPLTELYRDVVRDMAKEETAA
jgi:ABC-2 type transport system ATP-binding protein